MKAEWLSDARKIPDEVMNYLRRIAVRAVEDKGYNPHVLADVLGISVSSIYDWLSRYREGGEEALDTRLSPGAAVVITEEMDDWLKDTVLNSTPVDHGYDTVLWNRDILAELLKQHFGIVVAGNTVSLHLHKMNLSYQRPCYRARERDPVKVARFLEVTFPKIQKLAERMGADIAFEDEAGIGLATHSGQTWGEVGHSPEVVVTDRRGGYNVLSIVMAGGELRYSLAEQNGDGPRYVKFLQQLLRGRSRPLIVIADRASFHRAAVVRDFVRAHRTQIRLFFLPAHVPDLNPDEQVWNEVKHRRIGKQPVKNKIDLKKRIRSALKSLQIKTEKVQSFFQLPSTKFAAIPPVPIE